MRVSLFVQDFQIRWIWQKMTNFGTAYLILLGKIDYLVTKVYLEYFNVFIPWPLPLKGKSW